MPYWLFVYKTTINSLKFLTYYLFTKISRCQSNISNDKNVIFPLSVADIFFFAQNKISKHSPKLVTIIILSSFMSILMFGYYKLNE